MIPYPEARAILLREITPLPPVELPLGGLAGTVAAVGASSPIRVPGFDNTAMDGFALRSVDTAGACASKPVELAVAGSIAAGDPPPAATAPGTAWEIMTGAPLPPGCDCVIPVERVLQPAERNRRPGRIRLTESVAPGRNVRRAGEDFALGQRVIDPGQLVTPEVIMGLAATGLDRLRVHPTPRIALITTGSELLSAGLPDRPGLIRDSNGPYLRAFLAAAGLEPASIASAADDRQEIARCIGRACEQADIVISTGGVSAGRLDHVPAALAALGAEIWFHKVAIRPGKPVLCARMPGGSLFFGLPGNPIAVAVGLRFFVIPALRALQGRTPERYLTARICAAAGAPPDLHFFAKAYREIGADGSLRVRILPGQESFRIAPLLAANCWAIIPAGSAPPAPGASVETAALLPDAHPLEPVTPPAG